MTHGHEVADAPALLCVANYEAGTGFAWTFIERLYADAARRLADNGIRTWVAYPSLKLEPVPLQGSPARPLELAVRLGSGSNLLRVLDFVRRRNVRALYLADRSTWHPAYLLLRAAGVRWIVVHDHTSGARSRPVGMKRLLKLASRRLPGMVADRVIGVSDFVARRKVEVDLVPAERVVRIWNGIKVPEDNAVADLMVDRLDLPAGRPVIAAACRAAEEKGIQHLLRGFARLMQTHDSGSSRPLLVYMGDGPALQGWRALADDLGIERDVVFAGYRDDADELIGGASVAVVPSVWAEAFGLAALEPMAWGVPVVASRIGGLPEVVVDGQTGLLVPPGDEVALADALRALLGDEGRRREMGRNARSRVKKQFRWEDQIDSIATLLAQGLG